MIAIDTSSFIGFLSGAKGSDVDAVDTSLASSQAVLPTVVRCELLSDPALPVRVSELIRQLPMLPILDGFWDRAGILRAKLIARKRKAKLADALIAQACIDHDIPLVSRDRDFRQIAEISSLKLLP